MDVEVIIPFAGGCRYRARSLEWVRRQYRWPVTVAFTGLPFCKADAVNPAVQRSNAEIIVVADGDVWTKGVASAIQAVRRGAAWAIPHRKVYRLTEPGSRRFMDTRRFGHPFDQRPYRGMPGGGVVVASRKALLSVPLDHRFIGWGQEDESWALALSTLVGGPWRGDADLVHLWHPSEPRLSRRKGSRVSWGLFTEYRAAFENPDRMTEVLKEAV